MTDIFKRVTSQSFESYVRKDFTIPEHTENQLHASGKREHYTSVHHYAMSQANLSSKSFEKSFSAQGGWLAEGDIGSIDLLAFSRKLSRIQSTHDASLDCKADGPDPKAIEDRIDNPHRC